MNTPHLSRLRVIETPGGDVRHALKRSETSSFTFGEAYFSTVQFKAVKGWKRHHRMTLSLIVPVGEIRFVVYSDQGFVGAWNLTADRAEDYNRLTVPPGYWLAFGGASEGLNMLLNIADLEHDPTESEQKPIDAFAWTWHS